MGAMKRSQGCALPNVAAPTRKPPNTPFPEAPEVGYRFAGRARHGEHAAPLVVGFRSRNSTFGPDVCPSQNPVWRPLPIPLLELRFTVPVKPSRFFWKRPPNRVFVAERSSRGAPRPSRPMASVSQQCCSLQWRCVRSCPRPCAGRGRLEAQRRRRPQPQTSDSESRRSRGPRPSASQFRAARGNSSSVPQGPANRGFGSGAHLPTPTLSTAPPSRPRAAPGVTPVRRSPGGLREDSGRRRPSLPLHSSSSPSCASGAVEIARGAVSGGNSEKRAPARSHHPPTPRRAARVTP